MNLTERNHINPCFWTALWNKTYYDKYIEGIKHTDSPRNQLLNYLEINSGQKLLLPAERIHFEKKLGYAKVTPTQMEEFVKKYYPDKFDEYLLETAANKETLYFDFENHFTGLENSPAYQVLLKFIRNPVLEKEDKIWLTLFIQLHWLRIGLASDYKEKISSYPGGKFEYLWLLKQNLQNPFYLLPQTLEIANSHWTIYKSKGGDFPLSDVSIILDKNSITATLSPYLLVIINLNKRQDQEILATKKRLPIIKNFKFKKMVLANCSKGLIFLNESTLNRWLTSNTVKKIRKSRSQKRQPESV